MKRCTCCGRIYVSERDFLRGTSRWRKCSRGDLYFNCTCNSTLMLVAGKHDWYTPDMFMSRDAASIFNELTQMRELPLLPEAAMQIQMLLAEPNSSLDDLVKAVRSDPLFSMNILTAANAARMPGSQPIKSLKEAIAYVGRSRLAELSYPAAMVSFEFRTTKYEKARYWSEAFTTGMVAESLARLYLPKESAEMAYFAGIFANVGKVVGSILVPEQIDSVYETTTLLMEPKNWTEAEKGKEVYDHHVLGEIAAAIWGLPHEVMDAIQHHHTPLPSGPVAGSPAHEVQHVATFAKQLSHMVRLESHRVDQAVLESCMRTFQFSDADVTQLIDGFSAYVERTNDLLAA